MNRLREGLIGSFALLWILGGSLAIVVGLRWLANYFDRSGWGAARWLTTVARELIVVSLAFLALGLVAFIPYVIFNRGEGERQ